MKIATAHYLTTRRQTQLREAFVDLDPSSFQPYDRPSPSPLDEESNRLAGYLNLSILNSMKNDAIQHKPSDLRRDVVCKKLLEMKPEFEARGITSIGLFGSVARDEATEHSDIDLAVTVKPGTGLFAFSGARLYAEDLLGVNVDLAILSDFSPGRLKSAQEDLIPIF